MTYNRLLIAAVQELKLDPSTVKLLYLGKTLTPCNVDDLSASDLIRSGALSPQCEVIAVGVRRGALTPSSPRENVAGTPSTTRARSVSGTPPAHHGPLSPVHVKEGLRSVVDSAEAWANDAAKKQMLQGHPTIRAIRDIVSRNPATLEAVLRQANEECKPFIKWVSSNQQLFLQLLNETPVNKEPSTALHALMRDTFRTLLAEPNATVEMIFNFSADEPQRDDTLAVHRAIVSDLKAEIRAAEQSAEWFEAANLHSRLASEYQRILELEAQGVVSGLTNTESTAQEADTHFLECCSLLCRLIPLSEQALAFVSTAAEEMFVSAEEWFVSANKPRLGLQVALQHVEFTTSERVSSVTSFGQPPFKPALRIPPFDALMRLERQSKEAGTVFVVYSHCVEKPHRAYVVRDGRVFTAQLPCGELMDSTVASMVQAVSKVETGLNANLVWRERLHFMYVNLIQPVEKWLPTPATERDPNAPKIVFVTRAICSTPLPFSAMCDASNIPAIVKWAVSQCSTASEYATFLAQTPTETLSMAILCDGKCCPSWLTHRIKKMLSAEACSHVPEETSTILHYVNDAPNLHTATDLLVSEQLVPPRVLGSACFKTAFGKLFDVAGEVPYELFRSFYVALTTDRTGGCAADAARRAQIEAAVASSHVWEWACFGVVGLETPLSKVREHVNRMHRQMRKQLSGTGADLSSSWRYHYLQRHRVDALFETLLEELLRRRPNSPEAVETCLQQILQERAEELSQLCASDVPDTPHGPIFSRQMSE